MKPEQVNKKLLWDYDWKESDYETEEFEKWYVQRVLTRGMQEDIDTIGLIIIEKYFSNLRLPEYIEHYWRWFFNRKNLRCAS